MAGYPVDEWLGPEPEEDDEDEYPGIVQGMTPERLEGLLALIERLAGISHEEMTDYLEDFLRRHTH